MGPWSKRSSKKVYLQGTLLHDFVYSDWGYGGNWNRRTTLLEGHSKATSYEKEPTTQPTNEAGLYIKEGRCGHAWRGSWKHVVREPYKTVNGGERCQDYRFCLLSMLHIAYLTSLDIKIDCFYTAMEIYSLKQNHYLWNMLHLKHDKHV